MEHFKFIAVMGGISIMLALGAWGCSHMTVKHPDDRMLFGIPLALIGILGYASIAVTAYFAPAQGWVGLGLQIVNHILVGFAALFTIYLVYKMVSIRTFCPWCFFCWCMNIVMGISKIRYAFT